MAHRTSFLIVLAVITALALGAAGCDAGGSDGSTTGATAKPSASATTKPTVEPTPSPTGEPASGETTTVLAYFLNGKKLASAERRVPATLAVARAAMNALCGGVNSFERAAGLTSSVPAGTTVRGIAVSGGTATVDLSREFASGGGTLSMTSRVAQVVYTLTQFRSITAVEFKLEGKPLDALGGEGILLETPQRRAHWESFEPLVFVERPGVGAYVASPLEVEGRGTVVEATVQIELLSGEGEILVRTFATATRGAPERGTFRKRLTFTTSAGNGVLTAYEQSMEDGSRLHEVRIPIRFSE